MALTDTEDFFPAVCHCHAFGAAVLLLRGGIKMGSKVLIVDDEREIADVVELYLKNENYQVVKCYNGRDALEAVEKEKPDLALLDVMLPDIDGFTILQKIREKYTFPVIMLTAKTEYMDKINGLTLGADDYIAKPFNPLELMARVKAQLRRSTKYNEGNRPQEDIIDSAVFS